MISPKKASEIVLKHTGYKHVYNVKDYDSKHYIVSAAPDNKQIYRTLQTTFGVNKNTGKVTAFVLNGSTYDSYMNAKVVL